jgi:hypothetical protein
MKPGMRRRNPFVILLLAALVGCGPTQENPYQVPRSTAPTSYPKYNPGEEVFGIDRFIHRTKRYLGPERYGDVWRTFGIAPDELAVGVVDATAKDRTYIRRIAPKGLTPIIVPVDFSRGELARAARLVAHADNDILRLIHTIEFLPQENKISIGVRPRHKDKVVAWLASTDLPRGIYRIFTEAPVPLYEEN